jgi:uncharacterized membrane protein YdjX (TVP38/TMEM64 family)
LDVRARIRSLLLLVHANIDRVDVTVALVAAHAVSVALCFPGTILFELFAGFAFGFVKAVLLVLSAKVLGGLLGLSLARTVFRRWAKRLIESRPQWQALLASIGAQGFQFALLLRLSPLPSYACNAALSLTTVTYVDFVGATVIGSLPFIANNVLVGSVARSIEATLSGDIPVDDEAESGAVFTRARVRSLFFGVGTVALLLLLRKLQLMLAAVASAPAAAAAPGAGKQRSRSPARRRSRSPAAARRRH